MSVEAISWALNLAPAPAARGGQPSSACKFVLAGLANHAGPDGTGAFPSVATLVRYTGLSERTVRTCLDRLEAAGIVSPCDPGIVAARIKRADRRPQGWDLRLGMVRDDLAEADIAVLERQFPGLAARLATTARPDPDLTIRPTGATTAPAPDNGEPVDNSPGEVQQSHPARGTGCNQHPDGVQLAQPRGAAVAPEPPREPSIEPPAGPAPARGAPADHHSRRRRAGRRVFASLGDGWRLTVAQRARLAPAVRAALEAGWLPHALAAFTGASTAGVRSPYVVLAARLSPGELPPPRGSRFARPPWCGECDQFTRMLGFDGDTPRPCPRCKPAAIPSRASPAPPLPRARTSSSGPRAPRSPTVRVH